MKYTEISKEFREDYSQKFNAAEFKMSDAREDPSKFAYFMLGITPYHYQDMFMNAPSKRVAICSSRQIGKSLSIMIKALHTAMFKKGSSVIIVNPSLEQSYKLLQGIKDLMYKGDLHMKSFGERYIKFFTKLIDKDRPNHSTQISLTNGSVIKSVPATKSARGNTADLVLVDEAAFMEDDIFEEIILPMVTHTDGKIILSSTPNGPKGFFYKYFDPEEKVKDNPYIRYWFHWTINEEETIRRTVLEAKATMDSLSFEQEYEAKFTSSKTSFFEADRVDERAIGVEQFEFKDYPCYVGIDWGLKTCKTVVTVGYYANEHFNLLFLKEFEVGFENHNIITFLERLMNDYNVDTIISDDGPISVTVNQMLEEKGFPIGKFDFNKQKIPTYMAFREWMNKGKVSYPPIPKLVDEMKALIYERLDSGVIRIHKPQTGFDDMIDSFICCFSPVVEQQEATGLILV